MADDAAAKALAEKEAGNVFYKNKDYDEAIAAYGRAIELDPESETAALCYSNRSAVFQIQKKFAKAEKDAQSCLAIKPDFVKGYIRLALSQRKQAKFEEAVKTINDGLTRSPNDADLLKAMGSIETAKKKIQAKAISAAKADAFTAARLETVRKELSSLQERREIMLGRREEVNMQAKQLYRGTRRTAITLQQLNELPEDCTSYMAVGKMFLRKPLSETKVILEEKTNKANASIQQLKSKEEYLTKILDDNDKEIKSLVASVQPR